MKNHMCSLMTCQRKRTENVCCSVSSLPLAPIIMMVEVIGETVECSIYKNGIEQNECWPLLSVFSYTSSIIIIF